MSEKITKTKFLIKKYIYKKRKNNIDKVLFSI